MIKMALKSFHHEKICIATYLVHYVSTELWVQCYKKGVVNLLRMLYSPCQNYQATPMGIAILVTYPNLFPHHLVVQ